MKSLFLILLFALFISCNIKESPYDLIEEAVRKGKVSDIEIIMKKYSIDLNDPNFRYKPLAIAVMRNNIEICEKLLELGSDINVRNPKGQTPLHLAAGWGKPEMVEYLLKKGADINARDYISWTPIMWASIRGKFNNVEILLSYGANPNSIDLDKNTPLILASYRNQKNVMLTLLKHGASRDLKNVYNQTFCDVLKSRGFSETAVFFSCP